MSAIAHASAGAGGLLRDWRRRRRMSQMDLGLEAGVSTRHLSFVETGRSQPSRELLLHLAEHLDIPLRDRNALLLAAGYAPVYPQTPLDDGAMAPVREALDKVLAGHAPYPAVIVDRRWNLISANAPALAILGDGVAPGLLEAPVNALRVSLHPDGLAPRIANLAEYGEHLLARLRREIALTADPELRALAQELAGYPGMRPASAASDPASRLFVALRLHALGEDLTFFSTIATFGTARDVTLDELSIESFYPGDEATAAVLRERF
jgi:transcriptional regulator with XRE-family HTH domain